MSGESGETGQEKSYDATPGKLERARKKGELPRSQDAQTTAAYLGLASALLLGGAWSAVYLGETLMVFLSRPGELAELLTSDAASAQTGQIVTRVLSGAAPILLGPMALILLLLVAQRAVVLAPDKLMPKLQRISPIANAKQKYGPQGLFEFVKSGVKLSAVGIVLAVAVYGEVDRLPSYVQIEPRQLGLLLDDQFWNILVGVLVVSFVIAVIDTAWQRHSHLRRMRMTHQEMKDESRQSDGDPHMRASRRERAREIANNRMLHAVPESDVVIVNPTHFAVALKWNRAKNTVPVCVAKGQDEIALSIRQRAEQADVPIHEDPPTARSLHAMVELNQPILPEHYKAVAAAIVFADKMRAKQRERSGAG